MRTTNRTHTTCCAVAAWLLLLACPLGAVEIPCRPIEVAFFDLGDTLIELDPISGLFVLRAGAADLIDDLQALGTLLGIITNTPPDWTRKDLEAAMATPEFLDEFEVVLLSSEANSPPKPDPAIFAEAHGLLNSPHPIDRAAFVTETLGEIANTEDNPTLGARAAGMVGIHLSSAAPSPLAEYTVHPDQLGDIVPIVALGLLFCDCFESGDTAAWSATVPPLGPRK